MSIEEIYPIHSNVTKVESLDVPGSMLGKPEGDLVQF
jgi:hypothetical protein